MLIFCLFCLFVWFRLPFWQYKHQPMMKWIIDPSRAKAPADSSTWRAGNSSRERWPCKMPSSLRLSCACLAAALASAKWVDVKRHHPNRVNFQINAPLPFPPPRTLCVPRHSFCVDLSSHNKQNVVSPVTYGGYVSVSCAFFSVLHWTHHASSIFQCTSQHI